MNLFTSMSSREELKTPVAPKTLNLLPILSGEELAKAKASLTYVVPGTYKSNPGKRGKKGRKMLVFPSPAQALRLNKIYNIIQTQPLFTFASSTTVPVAAGYSFALSSLDNVTALSSIFDQYRVALIEYTVMPRIQTIDQTGTIPGQIVTVVDLDDAATPSTFNGLLDYQGAVVSQGNKMHKHTFVPCVAVAAYSGVFTSFANESAPWIDIASTGVLHYGLKMASTISGFVATYDIKARVMVELRNVR